MAEHEAFKKFQRRGVYCSLNTQNFNFKVASLDQQGGSRAKEKKPQKRSLISRSFHSYT